MFLILNVGRPLANKDTCFGIEEDDETAVLGIYESVSLLVEGFDRYG